MEIPQLREAHFALNKYVYSLLTQISIIKKASEKIIILLLSYRTKILRDSRWHILFLLIFISDKNHITYNVGDQTLFTSI